MAFSKIEFDWEFNVFVDNDSISEERNKASILIGHAHNRAILLIDTMQTSYQFPTCIVQQQCNQYISNLDLKTCDIEKIAYQNSIIIVNRRLRAAALIQNSTFSVRLLIMLF